MNIMDQKISFIIPCYSSSKTIEQVCDDIVKTVRQPNYEIILVNDYSKDNTFEVIKKICANNTKVVGVNLARNGGQHNAIMAGLNIAVGDIIMLLDDDGQTDPKQMYKLFDALTEDVDVIYAGYPDVKQHSIIRRMGTKINDFMTCILLKKPKDIYLSSYIVMKSYVAKEIIKYHNPYSYVDGLILRTTSNIRCVNVEHQERISGKSGYSLRKLLSLWISGFTSFSIIPLRISMFFGIVFAIFGFIIGLNAIVSKLLNPLDTYIGWASIMATVAIIGGVTLLMLGMIGEYIGRIFISLNDSPQYVIKEIINQKKEQ